jgi:hypothetical protein
MLGSGRPWSVLYLTLAEPFLFAPTMSSSRSRLKPLLQPLLKEGEDATALLSRFPFCFLISPFITVSARSLNPNPSPRRHHILVSHLIGFHCLFYFIHSFVSLFHRV